MPPAGGTAVTRKSAPPPPDEPEPHRLDVARAGRAAADRRAVFLEAHHRVQNQLQLVVSVLGLATATQTDPKVTAVLQDVQDRLAAIGTINQVLAQGVREASVDLAASLRPLCRSFNDAFGELGTVELELEVAQCHLDFDTANCAALILHEALVNAFKHAFPRDGRGRAIVRLSRSEAACVLTIRDNGPGVALDQPGGTGIRLFEMLVDGSGGRFDITPSPNGTTVTVTFPLES